MMQPHTTLPLSLEGIALFDGIPSEVIQRVQLHCSWHRYNPGAPIVGYLDRSHDVLFIIQGMARVSIYSFAGKVVSFADLGPGDSFGEIPAIDGGPRSASVEAQTVCHVASMPAAAFRDMLISEPALALAALRKLAVTIRRLTTRVYEFSTLAASNRVQAEILRLAKLARREGKVARIALAPTHAEIASRVSTHREAVTRELNRLSRMGLVERRGRALVIKDVDRLAAMVSELTGE
jgi:CRP-like cAMP-binding protein